jgi:hypothetical protein
MQTSDAVAVIINGIDILGVKLRHQLTIDEGKVRAVCQLAADKTAKEIAGDNAIEFVKLQEPLFTLFERVVEYAGVPYKNTGIERGWLAAAERQRASE